MEGSQSGMVSPKVIRQSATCQNVCFSLNALAELILKHATNMHLLYESPYDRRLVQDIYVPMHPALC